MSTKKKRARSLLELKHIILQIEVVQQVPNMCTYKKTKSLLSCISRVSDTKILKAFRKKMRIAYSES